ncbi:MAG: FGGY family carbohydrate kinase [Muricomes sp.]
MKYYLGIDIGTSTAKITVIDEDGIVVGCCEQEYQYSQPKPGWKEIWPQVWVKAVKAGMAKLLSGIEPKEVEAIGVSGQMHTTIFLDQSGVPIRPAIMWNDVRTKDYFPKLKETLTQQDTRAISKIISTGSPAANLLWLRDNEEDAFKKLGKFVIGPDYLVYYLTGQYSTDYCQASTSSLYDTECLNWSETMMDLIGLSEDMYPPIKGSQEIVGNLRKRYRKSLDFRRM